MKTTRKRHALLKSRVFSRFPGGSARQVTGNPVSWASRTDVHFLVSVMFLLATSDVAEYKRNVMTVAIGVMVLTPRHA